MNARDARAEKAKGAGRFQHLWGWRAKEGGGMTGHQDGGRLAEAETMGNPCGGGQSHGAEAATGRDAARSRKGGAEIA